LIPPLVISKLEVIFCAFLAENNFVNALILLIRVRKYLDSKVGTAQFTLHAFYAGFEVFDRYTSALDLQNLLGTELDTDVTGFTVLFRYTNFR